VTGANGTRRNGSRGEVRVRRRWRAVVVALATACAPAATLQVGSVKSAPPAAIEALTPSNTDVAGLARRSSVRAKPSPRYGRDSGRRMWRS
jgi:hypothetical protein